MAALALVVLTVGGWRHKGKEVQVLGPKLGLGAGAARCGAGGGWFRFWGAA